MEESSSTSVNSSCGSMRTMAAMECSALSGVSWMYARDNRLQRAEDAPAESPTKMKLNGQSLLASGSLYSGRQCPKVAYGKLPSILEVTRWMSTERSARVCWFEVDVELGNYTKVPLPAILDLTLINATTIGGNQYLAPRPVTDRLEWEAWSRLQVQSFGVEKEILEFPPAYASTSPRLGRLYQLPVENDITAGAEWIYCLWTVLNRTNPSSYRASSELDSTARELCTLLMQSRSWGKRNIFKFVIKSYETNACNSDDVGFSFDLRRRCETAAPTLEHKM
ncbi:hypothetical protein EDD85DRAFT_790679 [Armillaria nabsnona]|nr:hypothetical protein EDD85DRAFT_790679 [Armillaria nabsnona]